MLLRQVQLVVISDVIIYRQHRRVHGTVVQALRLAETHQLRLVGVLHHVIMSFWQRRRLNIRAAAEPSLIPIAFRVFPVQLGEGTIV